MKELHLTFQACSHCCMTAYLEVRLFQVRWSWQCVPQLLCCNSHRDKPRKLVARAITVREDCMTIKLKAHNKRNWRARYKENSAVSNRQA